MNYTEKELAAVAARENNNKRKYLVVNRLQGKHIPVSPKKSLDMFDALAEKINEKYRDEKLLVVGFTETATAIGSEIAVKLGCLYMQTTRENIEGAEYLYFTESHSHATEQKLVKECVETALNDIDRIVFAEDEITTGSTILKIVDIIREKYGRRVKFAASSILNGMDEDFLEIYRQNEIETVYLVRTDHGKYTEIAEKYRKDGEYMICRTDKKPDIREYVYDGCVNARLLTDGPSYKKACEGLWEFMSEHREIFSGDRVLVVGTEEFMYPPIFIASELEKLGIEVYTHSTTRSPISVSTEEEYPLYRRFQLVSLYDEERTTYIYDIEKYDSVIIITDSQNVTEKGLASLLDALSSQGNEKISLIKWLNTDKQEAI